MNNLIPFNFESQPVRVIVRDGNPWFVAADVCAALDYRHVPHAMRMLDDDEKDVQIVDTLGGKQKATIICEPGLYRLIEKSRKPEAVPFRRWIWHEVLPSIRKTGSYSLKPAAVTLDIAEAYNLAGLFQLIDMFKEDIKRTEQMLRLVNSPYAPAMYDAWHEPACFMAGLRNVQQRCNTVRQKRRQLTLN